MTDEKKDKELPLPISIIIRIICAIPYLKDVFDKELLSETAKKYSTWIIYIFLISLILMILPLVALLIPAKDNNTINDTKVFFQNNSVIYYFGVAFLVVQFILLRPIFEKYKIIVKVFVIVIMFIEMFSVYIYSKSLIMENKYYSGPLYARKLFLKGNYNEALGLIRRMKQEKKWKFLIHENNDLENRIITTVAYSDTLEKRLSDLAEKKNYLELLDLLLFQSKVVPKSTYSSYYFQAISSAYYRNLATILDKNKITNQYFSTEEKIVRNYLLGKPLSISKYDSILLATSFSSQDSLKTAKTILNDSLIRIWLSEIKQGISD